MKTSSRKTTLKRTPTRAPLRAFGACVAALLALGTLAPSRADTVISAPAAEKDKKNPPPKGVPLCLGQNIVRVDFSKANFDKSLAKLSNQPCLLMGMINGRVVAADVDQDPKKPTADKLFFIDLLDSKTASFSGLLEDCIVFDGGPVKKRLADYVNKDIAYADAPLCNRRGQLLQWTLPPADPKKPEDAKNLVLMTNGYQKGGIDIYTLAPDPVKSGNAQITNKVKMTYKTTKLLGNFGSKLNGSDLYVNALDCIDLNGFKADDNKTDYPKALMVWCKPDGCKGYDNLQLSAPVYLLSCTLDNDSDTPVPVNEMVDFGIKCYSRQGSTTNEWENVVGGFVVAPTRDGKLRYWCVKSSGKVDHCNDQTWNTWFEFKGDLKAISLPVLFDSGKKAVVVQPNGRDESVFNRFQKSDDDDYALRDVMTREYNVENAGPGFAFDNDADKTVRLNGVVVPSCDKKTSGDDKIGITENAEDPDIASLNKGVTINGGKVDTVDLKARLLRLKRTQGTNVVRVILGWPYVAIPDHRNPAAAECPYIKITKSNTTVDQNSFNNGLSWSLEYGARGGVKDVSSFGAGVKAGYEYKYDHMKNNSFTVEEVGTYPALQSAKDADAAKAAYENGAVFSTKVVPQFTRVSKVIPSKEKTTLNIEGDPGTFICYAVGMQLAPDADNVTMAAFNGKDPSNTGSEPKTYQDWEDGKRKGPLEKFQTDYSVLSDGLLKRPIGSLLVYKVNAMDKELNEQFDAIRKWQKSNPLVEDLHGFCNGGGVAPYGRTEGREPGCYVSNFNNAKSLSVTTGSTDIVTSSHQGYVGLYYEWESNTPFAGFKSKGDCVYKGGKSEMHSKSATDAFTLYQPGHSAADNERWYYFYNIDVPALKSYMLSHSYRLRCSENRVKTEFLNEAVRPTFIPKYCWDANQSFVLGFPWIPEGNEKQKKKTASNN
jgi:hypothetical protein